MSKLLRKVRQPRNLDSAWRSVLQNGRNSKSDDVKSEIGRFQDDVNDKLRAINRQLQKGTFKFEKAKGVPIPKGKDKKSFRPIVLAPIESRIVQRALLNVLLENKRLRKYFINPFSFGGIKKNTKNELGGVPAAIKGVLEAIQSGAQYVVCSDISKFFTRVPKAAVSEIIAASTKDEQFVDFFNSAIKVELANMAELREKADAFPINEIGVAQGNSLSPLLGNMVLHDFDAEMNSSDCPCLRYIDDFIILAPTKRAARARLVVAKSLLKKKGMDLAVDKTHDEPRSIKEGFEFLGIEMRNGLVRPSRSAQTKFINAIDAAFTESEKAFFGLRNGKKITRSRSLVATLKRIDGIISGWSKHYYFCNDTDIFLNLERKISERTKKFLGIYGSVRDSINEADRILLFGLTSLTSDREEAFEWITSSSKISEPIIIPVQSEPKAPAPRAIILGQLGSSEI